MGKTKPKKAGDLAVRVMFEPSRLASVVLADAYEHACPVVRRRTAVAATHGLNARNESDSSSKLAHFDRTGTPIWKEG